MLLKYAPMNPRNDVNTVAAAATMMMIVSSPRLSCSITSVFCFISSFLK